jgi:hypothetical protein
VMESIYDETSKNTDSPGIGVWWFHNRCGLGDNDPPCSGQLYVDGGLFDNSILRPSGRMVAHAGKNIPLTS